MVRVLKPREALPSLPGGPAWTCILSSHEDKFYVQSLYGIAAVIRLILKNADVNTSPSLPIDVCYGFIEYRSPFSRVLLLLKEIICVFIMMKRHSQVFVLICHWQFNVFILKRITFLHQLIVFICT